MLSFQIFNKLHISAEDNSSETLKELFNMNHKLKKEIEDLSLLREVILSIHSTLELEPMLKSILELIKGEFNVKKILIYQLDPLNGNLNPAVGISGDVFLQGTQFESKNLNYTEGLIGKAFTIKKTIFVKDDEKTSYYICPLLTNFESIGLMLIEINSSHDTDEKEDFTSFIDLLSKHLAVAVHNSVLYSLAVTDGLTGLYVHRYFQLKMEESFKLAKRYNIPFAFALFDIDHFKKFNDTYGHQTGDIVLRNISKIIKDSIRDTDIACRYGGEELAVIMPSTNTAGAVKAAETIRLNIESAEFKSLDNKSLKVTVSAGVASYNNIFANRTSMIESADKALYIAKENGRNQIVCNTSEMSKAS